MGTLSEARRDTAARDLPQNDEIRRELARVVGSAPMRGSLRLTHFLTFVVEATLAGRGDRIKAYTVAVEALGRGSNFDPQSDPIVRVEAGRLRGALARYYAGAGCDDPLWIDLPRGSYVPTFRWRGVNRPQAPAAALAPETASKHGRRLNQSLTVFRALLENHQQQVAAVAAEIESARQTLTDSQALLQVAHKPAIACRPDLPLLPTAPSSRAEASRTADGRQAQRSQQDQGTPAAWPDGPWAGGTRRDAANAGDDPQSVRTLRLRAGGDAGDRIHRRAR
jgi:hypothetical protein